MKKTLRKETIAAMKQLPESVKTQADEELTQRLLELPAFQEAKTLATHLSFDHEVSTASLIQAALQLENASVFPAPIHKGEWNLWNTILIFWKRHALVCWSPMKRKACGTVRD